MTWINNNSALFTDDVVSTACVALYDYTTAKISNSGVLLGVLCMDVHEGMQVCVCLSVCLSVCLFVCLHTLRKCCVWMSGGCTG